MPRRRSDWVLAGLLAAVSYIPLLATKPGMVAADTKQYLYLDPAKLTTGAASMWDPNTGMGTVTHQNIGYLFPMGPYYTAVHWLGIPVWIGQRIWMGSLLMAAGLGVAYCCRQLGLEGPGRAVAAFAYTLSPYTLVYLDRISAILMPWAALGWMVGLTAVAARSGRWRHAGAFAVVVALVGGVNATSILLVLVAPALWLIHAVWVRRELTWKQAAATAARLGTLSVLVSLWWAAGLWAEGRYGINVLRVTETVPTVARTSSAAEALRGLGYWYFYGWDKVQPWTLPAVSYTQSLWLIGVSFLLPAASVVFGLTVRWVYRSLALGLVGVGTVVAVGAFPYAHPSLVGAAIKGASAGSTVALALRSFDRIVPLVVLGLALLLGSGVAGLHLTRPGLGWVAGAGSLGLVAVNFPALWTGGVIASNLDRPSELPAYWTQAAAYMNSRGSSTRVLGLPGEDFAAYAWGVTSDPVGPGLLDRPYVGRQVVPSGTPAAANLLQSVDEPLQEGTLDPKALAPLARLMSVGQVLLQSDLQYERYHLPLPQYLWGELVPPPAGLSGPATFGAPNPAPTIRYPLDSELRLGLPAGDPQPPALAVFDVSDPRPLVRTESAQQPMIIEGDGAGVVEAADAGVLSGGGNQPILYGPALGDGPDLARAMSAGAELVLTDTNALATARWGSLRDNVGQVEQPGAGDLVGNPSDYSLPLFPGESQADRTAAVVSGVASVQASQYGDPLTFTPEDRPINAVDGNASTAWSFGAYEPVTGARLQIDLKRPLTTDHVELTQAQLVSPNRRISAVTLLFDGARPVTVHLTPASFQAPGQTVSFSARKFSQLTVVVDGATAGSRGRYDGLAPVGLAEVAIPGVGPGTETLQLPTGLLGRVGTASIDHPLAILMQRQRAVEPPRHDPELSISRSFVLPTARTFDVDGTAEVNTDDSDDLINQLVGLNAPATGNGAAAQVVAANSSTRLVEDRQSRANAAVDGNPATAWIAETGPQAGEWLSFTFNRPVSFDHLNLQVINDGRHSLPIRLTVTAGVNSETVDVPEPATGVGRAQGATTSIPLDFPTLRGQTVKIAVDAVRPVRALDYYSTFVKTTDILPVGIAELGLAGVSQPRAPDRLPGSCQDGLLSIDGRPVDVAVTGTTDDALAGRQLSLQACGNSVAGVVLGPGPHTVQTSPRLPSGWSIDQLWLESGAGGPAARMAPVAGPPTPALRVDSQNRTSMTITVDGDGSPFWLVLGQSFSAGWTASLAGQSLGAPKLIDGYANGWPVPAGRVTGPTVIHLDWAPQRIVWVAIAVSAASVVFSLIVAVWPEGWNRWRRRRRPSRPSTRTGPPPVPPASWSAFAGVGAGPTRASPGVRMVAVTAVGWGVLAWVASRPVIGAAAAVAVVVGATLKRGRLLVRLVAVGALLSLVAYSVWQQGTHGYWPDIGWPGDLTASNDIAWLALSCLGADLVAGALRRSAYPGRLEETSI